MSLHPFRVAESKTRERCCALLFLFGTDDWSNLNRDKKKNRGSVEGGRGGATSPQDEITHFLFGNRRRKRVGVPYFIGAVRLQAVFLSS